MSKIATIFHTYGPEYLSLHGDAVPPQHRKVIEAILRCRTPQSGATVYRCDSCGEDHVLHLGCGNRHCPICQHHKGRQWLQRQLERQMPGAHFMVTFTVPEQLRPFMRSNQRLAYAALFAASSDAMRTLAKDPRFVGGDLPGFFGVMHTWGRQLQYHPHIHYVVTGGALDSGSGEWHPARNCFYLPVKALSPMVRAKFRDRITKAGRLGEIPASVWTTDWNVNCQAVGDAEGSLKYLAPYVFRTAISNSRIVSVENDRVIFSYKKRGSSRLRTRELSAMEFIRLFLQHVLPWGFMKVRYYGFLSPGCRIPLEEVRARIQLAHGFTLTVPKIKPESRPSLTCRQCGKELEKHYLILPPRRKPEKMARTG
ncbi:MAG: transposase [Anaerolineales bacterium]